MIRHWIFDWSGTIADDLTPVIAASNGVLALREADAEVHALIVSYQLELAAERRNVFEALVHAVFHCLGRLGDFVQTMLAGVDSPKNREDMFVRGEEGNGPSEHTFFDVVRLLQF